MTKLVTLIDGLWRIGNPSESTAYIGNAVSGGPSNCALIAEGFIGFGVRGISTDVVLDATYGLLHIDCSAGQRNVYAPSTVSDAGQAFLIKKSDTTGNRFLLFGQSSQLIEFSAAGFLSGSTQGSTVGIYSDGTNWRVFLNWEPELESTSAAVIATAGTVTTAGVTMARLAPAGAVTGVIMAAGTRSGQVVTVVNQSAAASSITMAAAGTSNVADGVSSVIAGVTSRRFRWVAATSLWYPEK